MGLTQVGIPGAVQQDLVKPHIRQFKAELGQIAGHSLIDRAHPAQTVTVIPYVSAPGHQRPAHVRPGQSLVPEAGHPGHQVDLTCLRQGGDSLGHTVVSGVDPQHSRHIR